MSSYLTGFVRGWGGAHQEEQQRSRQEADTQMERERKILEHLSTADDPWIRQQAMSGLLQAMAPGAKSKPKKGFAGLMGQYEPAQPNPQLAQIQAYMSGAPMGGATSPPQYRPTETQPGAAAQPGWSAIEPRAQQSAPAGPREPQGPQAFLSEEEKRIRELQAPYHAVVNVGAPPEKALEVFLTRMQGSQPAEQFRAVPARLMPPPQLNWRNAPGEPPVDEGQPMMALQDLRRPRMLKPTGEPLGPGETWAPATPLVPKPIGRAVLQYDPVESPETKYTMVVPMSDGTEVRTPNAAAPGAGSAGRAPTSPWTNVVAYNDLTTGKTVIKGINKATGRLETIPDSAGMVPPGEVDPSVRAAKAAMDTVLADVKARLGSNWDLMDEAEKRAELDAAARGFDERYTDWATLVRMAGSAPREGSQVPGPAADPGIDGKGVAWDHAKAREMAATVQKGLTLSPYQLDWFTKYRERYGKTAVTAGSPTKSAPVSPPPPMPLPPR